MIIIELGQPIKAHGEDRQQVELREPNGGDIAACGYPFRFYSTEDGNTVGVNDTVVISAMIARLGNIPRSAVNQMTIADWHACMVAVLGFFGASEPTLSTDALTLPLSGNGTHASH